MRWGWTRLTPRATRSGVRCLAGSRMIVTRPPWFPMPGSCLGRRGFSASRFNRCHETHERVNQSVHFTLKFSLCRRVATKNNTRNATSPMARSVTVRGTTSGDADPSPVWVLRHHSPCPITALAFVDPNVSVYGEEEGSDSDDEQDGLSRTSAFILEGDADGRVSLTDLNTLRPVLEWQAHRQGHSILGVEMWHNTIVTHGRDNTFKVWKMPLLNPRKASFATQDEIAANEHSTTPSEVLIHEVNALNFCRFSLLPIGTDGKQEALLAVPHTLESGWVSGMAPVSETAPRSSLFCEPRSTSITCRPEGGYTQPLAGQINPRPRPACKERPFS